MTTLPSVSDEAAFESAIRDKLPPTFNSFKTIVEAYLAEPEALRRRFLLILANIEQNTEISTNPLVRIFNPSETQNFQKLAETLLLYQHLLEDESQTDAFQQAWLHYVINTDGAIRIDDKDGESDEKDQQVFNWAERYANMFNIGLEDDGKSTWMHYGVLDPETFHLGRHKRVHCSKWGKLKKLTVEYSLREVGQAINGNRYGYKDVIQSNLFDFQADDKAHNKIDAMYLADLSNLAYRYEAYVAMETRRLGFEMVQWIENTETDTQGFIAKGHGALVIVFRGTSRRQDWITDLKAKPTSFSFKDIIHGQVHLGFKQAIESVWDTVISTLMEPELQGIPIFIAGHSLGGALAKLAAIKLVNDTDRIPTVYTFGAPRVGNSEFVALYNEYLGDQTYLHVNNKDIIPHGVPFSLGYRHVGRVIQQFDEQHGIEPIETMQWGIRKTIASLFGVNDPSDMTPLLLDTLNEDFEYIYDDDITPIDSDSLGGYSGGVDRSRAGYIDDHQITEYMFKLACSRMDELFGEVEHGT